ncbi:retrovirus-related pol polyprotein from transposon TNT 1-94, partial [Tanacetum coccineum]
MLIHAKAPLFLWAEAVSTACYTQNHSIIHLRHGKTPYEILHDIPPYLSFFHLFGALCYPTNDSENLGKLQPKADIGIFIGYAPTKKAFQIYNRRTRRIIETIHVDFDELTAMASEHSSSGLVLHEMTPAIINEEDKELYGDLNLNLDRRDVEMTDAQTNQETKEVYVTLTTEPPVVQQQSSPVSSDLVSKFINPSPDTETELSELKQTNKFAKALSSISGIVDNYLASKMKDAVNVAVRLHSNKLREEAQAENDEFLKQIESNIKAIIKNQ